MVHLLRKISEKLTVLAMRKGGLCHLGIFRKSRMSRFLRNFRLVYSIYRGLSGSISLEWPTTTPKRRENGAQLRLLTIDLTTE